MYKAFVIAHNKIRRQLRQPLLFLVMLALPLLFTFFMGSMNTEDARRIPVFFVDNDHSRYSQKVIDNFKAQPCYRVLTGSREEAVRQVQDFKVQAAFIINEGFGEALEANKAPRVDVIRVRESGEFYALISFFRSTVHKVASNLKIAGLALAEISRAKDVTGRADLITERAYRRAAEAWFPQPPVGLNIQSYSSGKQTTPYNQMVHAAIGFALFFVMYTVIFSIGDHLEERKQGTWQRLLTLPVSRRAILGGSLLGSFALGMVQITLLVLAGKFLFGVNWGANLPGVLLVITAFVFCATCLGLLLSSLAKTTAQLQAVTPVLVVSTSMLGGCFWPLDIVNVPLLLTLARVVPQSWAVTALEDLVGRGAALGSVVPHILVLLLMGILFFGLALKTLRWET
jgi:ABC-2 type transport system permease protein